jgi:hypothetical protein
VELRSTGEPEHGMHTSGSEEITFTVWDPAGFRTFF